MSWKTRNGAYRCIAHFKGGAERKRQRLAAEEDRDVIVRAFSSYRSPLETLISFRDLGQVILAADDNCVAVVKNLSREREVWRKMTCILSKEGAAPWVSGFIFKAMVQAVLLFRSEIWVVIFCMDKALGGV